MTDAIDRPEWWETHESCLPEPAAASPPDRAAIDALLNAITCGIGEATIDALAEDACSRYFFWLGREALPRGAAR